jgi:Arc/MetJ family transcription regulator
MVKRTTVEVDFEALERAQELLGTTTMRETIDKALREVDRRARLRHAADLIRSGGLSLPTPEDLAEIRKPRSERQFR